MFQTKNFDDSFCGNLPLHLTNLIQPHGALLVISVPEFEIIQVSDNIAEYTGIAAVQLVGQNLENILGTQQFNSFTERLQPGAPARLPMTISVRKDGQDVPYLALVHTRPNHLLLELESRNNSSKDHAFFDFYQKLRYLMSSIEGAQSREEVCRIVVKELSLLSGYDRVMIYQFDEEWNGSVVAEAINAEGLEPYLGLKFPASDVPRPARELYYRNPYRLIPNRDYKASRLYPVLNPLKGGFTDLSDCNLRSVAGVHLEYLANMNVMASMSTRIIMENKLWGLISCHHSSEKYLDFEMCSVFELLSNVFSSRLHSLTHKDEFRFRSQLQDVQMILHRQIEQGGLISGLLSQTVTVLDLFQAQGAALIRNNKISTIGQTPDDDSIRDLVSWLQTNQRGRIYSTSNLSERHDSWNEFSEVASGILAVPFGSSGDYIIGFRPEIVHTVNWGGNPNEAVIFDKDVNSYHPRNSFKQWQQSVRNTSLGWQPYVLEVAARFWSSLMEYSLKTA